MMNELIVKEITIEKGKILFPEYEGLMSQARELATFIKEISVTDENVKDTKRIIAKANAAVKLLNDRRIEIKKAFNEPYLLFEQQIREIQEVVKEADIIVRTQIKEIEEKEREDKKEKIKAEWNKRIKLYPFVGLVRFDDFLDDAMLNKTTLISKVEKQMGEYLEKISMDVKTLRENFDEEHVAEYFKVLNANLAIANVKERRSIQEKITALPTDDFDEEKEKLFIFIVSGEKDGKLTEMLLKENRIEFKKTER